MQYSHNHNHFKNAEQWEAEKVGAKTRSLFEEIIQVKK